MSEVYRAGREAERDVLVFTVSYKQLTVTEINEVEAYDAVTLLANFGGMLGLMTGMSALSLIEILVWFVLSVVARLQRCWN